MNTLPPNPSPAIAPPGTVCRGRACWHGLKGLDIASVCPECGTPIARSVDASWWGNGPAEPLARLAASIGALIGGGIAFLLFFCGSIVADYYQATTQWPRWVDITTAIAMTILWFWMALSLRRAALAAQAARLSPGWPTRVTGYTAVASCVMLIPLQAASLANPDGFTGVWQWVPLVFTTTSAVMFLCWTFAQLRTARSLGRQPLAALSWLQVLPASVLTIAFAVAITFEFAYNAVSTPKWQFILQEASSLAAAWAFGLLLLLTTANVLLLRLFVRRFLSARASAM